MRILFAAHEDSWGGCLKLIREELPQHDFEATGGFWLDSLEGFDVLIPTMCPVTRHKLATANQLKLIQQCGAGLEGIDLQAAWERNIRVANVPTDISGNADSVAELGVYLMIGLSRDVRGMAQSFSNHRLGVPRGQALRGKVAGLVGLGGIGRALARRLRAFDMRLLGIKRSNPGQAEQSLGLEWVGGPDDIKELLGRSDYVVLCLPATQETNQLLNSDTFAAMKPGAYLINLGRGGLVDRDALEEALSSGRIAGAGLDVFWEEPPDPNDPIFGHNVLATPHIAGSTDISVQGIVQAVAENIRRIEARQEPLYLKTPENS